MTQNILELHEISKSFSGVEVLHQVSFSLKRGEVHALLGENGAGKSTLVKIITGAYQPDGGEINYQGNPMRFADTRDSREAGIGAIYQELSLFPDLNLAENIFVGRHPLAAGERIDWPRLYAEAQELLSSLGVELNLKHKARSLTIAQQQMIEIARAISTNSRILIMDEPTSSLTLNEVAELFRLVRRLRNQGTAIIFISHRLEELYEVADRVTVLRDGNYIDTCEMKSVQREDLIQMMVGRKIDNLFPKQQVDLGPVALKVTNLSTPRKFHNISFEIHEGEIVGLAGLVGAGRTYVARALFGVEPSNEGEIYINGKKVDLTSPEKAIEAGIAYVPEDRQLHGIIPPMDIKANISLPILKNFSQRGWLNNGKEQEASIDAARQMEVRANSISQQTRELSGGNQQKVVLAKWLNTKPRILILDEPTRGIDVGTKAAVHALMNKLAADGIAILLISSELPEILAMSDRILVMREGILTGQYSRDEATQGKIISAATQSIKGRRI